MYMAYELQFFVIFEKSHYHLTAFELMFHFPLFLRNFHHISASWRSHFRKVSFLSFAV